MAAELGEIEELVEEILIRLPKDEPGNLLRSSLACKPWHDLASHAFCRHHGDFHRTPPMLGFLRDWPELSIEFFPTTDFLARGPDPQHQYAVEDCRHGRILLRYFDEDMPLLVIRDPMTGSEIVLGTLKMSEKQADVEGYSILKYDLGTSCLSEIHLSEEMQDASNNPILMVGEDGRLGIAHLFFFCLSVWWREVDPDGVVSWTQRRDIDLETLLPTSDFTESPELVGSIEAAAGVVAEASSDDDGHGNEEAEVSSIEEV
uniref:F-box domain-containing protein n=1 Tax=Aegilops tauschii TaxID=37682 RepID=M8B3V8_AEGTA